MENIEQCLKEAQAEMDIAVRVINSRRSIDTRFVLRACEMSDYQQVIYHVVIANYYQNQAIVGLLRERQNNENGR